MDDRRFNLTTSPAARLSSRCSVVDGAAANLNPIRWLRLLAAIDCSDVRASSNIPLQTFRLKATESPNSAQDAQLRRPGEGFDDHKNGDFDSSREREQSLSHGRDQGPGLARCEFDGKHR